MHNRWGLVIDSFVVFFFSCDPANLNMGLREVPLTVDETPIDATRGFCQVWGSPSMIRKPESILNRIIYFQYTLKVMAITDKKKKWLAYSIFFISCLKRGNNKKRTPVINNCERQPRLSCNNIIIAMTQLQYYFKLISSH